MATIAPAAYADLTDDDFIEVEWVQGSGYGWALTEQPGGPGYAVILVNEDAVPLAVLRTFRSGLPSREFTNGITLAILNGRGHALLAGGAAIPPHSCLNDEEV